ncbi:hypothetical protein [Fundidesulfovibrio agrisoli]|uniref:hypothetical protein n=1 Tax=Fundidesulfovibrio agrisoli TaxID=2922717 RepID=UPI001FAD0F66|nr:hypothetical protein [Fundidesulfovibrio agrisoli]
MADELVTTAEDKGKDLIAETLDETIYMALAPLKEAVDRIYWHHQDDQEVVGSLMILERLIRAAEDRLEAFDKGVLEHLGVVGLYHRKLHFVGMDRREYLGAKFTPKASQQA